MTEFHRPDRSRGVAADFDRSNGYQQEDIHRARQAAEALFAPKQPVTEPAASMPAASPDQTTRKPRILSAVQAQPVRVEPVEQAVKRLPSLKRKKIPAAHFARIRTWLEYGMNILQISELYGVPIAEIDNILSRGTMTERKQRRRARQT